MSWLWAGRISLSKQEASWLVGVCKREMPKLQETLPLSKLWDKGETFVVAAVARQEIRTYPT